MDHIKTLAVQVVEHHTVTAIGITKGLFVLDLWCTASVEQGGVKEFRNAGAAVTVFCISFQRMLKDGVDRSIFFQAVGGVALCRNSRQSPDGVLP